MRLFVGCVLYAHDILLLSFICRDLKSMFNICADFGYMWDILLNPAQHVTFVEQAPNWCTPAIGTKNLQCCTK